MFLFEIANMTKPLQQIKDAVFSMSLQYGNVMWRKYIFFPEQIRYYKTRHLLLIKFLKFCLFTRCKKKKEIFAAMENEHPCKPTCTICTLKNTLDMHRCVYIKIPWAISDISAHIFSKRKLFLLQHLNSNYFSVISA